MAERFRGFLPVVVDVETGGFNVKTDALLEIAAVLLDFDEMGKLQRSETIRYHVKPFAGANMDPASLAVNGIVPDHPLRPAIDERDALQRVFREVRAAVREITGGKGADVIYDSVGGDVFEQSLKCIAWNGRLLVIGFASGTIPQVAIHRVLLHEKLAVHLGQPFPSGGRLATDELPQVVERIHSLFE